MSLYGRGVYSRGRYSFTPDTFTQRIYDRLPTLYRDADHDLTLLRYLTLLSDQANEVETLLDRISYSPPDEAGQPGDTSDLVDPATADVRWLPWLAQLVGVTVQAGTTEQGMRDTIAGSVTGFRAGTKNAITAAAQSALTGTRFVQVYDHSINSPGDGGQWDVLLVTRASETPDVPAVLQAIADKRAKPAGVVLHHRAFSSDWSSTATNYPTWASRAGKTWAEIEETGL